MLSWFFGLGRMTKIVAYIAAILGMVVAGFNAWDAIARHF